MPGILDTVARQICVCSTTSYYAGCRRSHGGTSLDIDTALAHVMTTTTTDDMASSTWTSTDSTATDDAWTWHIVNVHVGGAGHTRKGMTTTRPPHM